MKGVLAISGANGFLGRHVVSAAIDAGFAVRSLVRQRGGAASPSTDVRELGDLGTSTLPSGLLDGCDTLIHGAARAHVVRETEADPLTAFRRINVDGTVRLAEAAIAAGVRRFVYVSSIGVLGNHSLGRPFRVTDQPAPVEDYAISKAEAESALAVLAERSQLEIIIIRPPLVHGPGAKGNFDKLLHGIARGRPFPLGGVRNRRSFIGVANLAQVLVAAATGLFPARTRQQGGRAATYLVADDGVISTRRLIEVLAEEMHVTPRLISLPKWLVVGVATLLGKGSAARRLFADLEVDDHDFRRDFSWKPAMNLEEGLRLMAAAHVHAVSERTPP